MSSRDERRAADRPEPAPEGSPLPLLCRLGRHEPGGLAHWNDGYYFARCRRCGHDVVRTAYGRWTIPRGFRVIWGPHPPRDAPAARLFPVDGPPAPVGDRVEFPIAEPVRAPETAKESQAAVDEAPDEPASADARSSTVEGVYASGSEPRTASDAEGADPSEELRITALLRALRVDDAGRGKADRGAPGMPPPIVSFSASALGEVSPVSHGGEDAVDEPESEAAAELERVAAPMAEAELAAEVEHVEVEPISSPLASDAAPSPDPAPAGPAATPPKPLIPDFMEETSFEIPYDLQTGRILRPSERREAANVFADGSAPPAAVRPVTSTPLRATSAARVRVRVGERVRRAGASARAAIGPARSTSEGQRPFLERHGAIAGGAVFGAFVFAAALVGRSDDASAPISHRPIVGAQPSAPRSETPAPAAVPAPRPVDRAVVTASLLNCRTRPDDAAAVDRRLSRGASVEVLGADAGWAVISYRGRRCWAAAEHLSSVRPL